LYTNWQDTETQRSYLFTQITALLDFGQSLSDFFNLDDSQLVFTLLYDSLNLVINAVQLWMGCRESGPQRRKNEAESFAMQRLNCDARTMSRGRSG